MTKLEELDLTLTELKELKSELLVMASMNNDMGAWARAKVSRIEAIVKLKKQGMN
jgi:hypothetical protein